LRHGSTLQGLFERAAAAADVHHPARGWLAFRLALASCCREFVLNRRGVRSVFEAQEADFIQERFVGHAELLGRAGLIPLR
jgi:hypothetical protein